MAELSEKEQEIRELKEKIEGGDIAMGLANEERRAYPIETIDTVHSLIDELQERLGCLERNLSPILHPEQSTPEEKKNPSDVEAPARSDVMMALEVTESKVRACVQCLNHIIGRLDL